MRGTLTSALIDQYITSSGNINDKNPDDKNKTVLHYAAEQGKNDIVKYLLNKGADDTLSCSSGELPLHFAAIGTDVQTLHLLLEKAKDVNVKHNDKTPLYLGIKIGNPQIIDLLLAQPTIKVNEICSHKKTALHSAAEKGLDTIVKKLISAGAKLDVINENGNTPLHDAAYSGSVPTAQLLTTQTLLHTKNTNKNTPFHVAAKYGHLNIIQYFHSIGAQIYEPGKKTAIELAISNKRWPVVNELINYGATIADTTYDIKALSCSPKLKEKLVKAKKKFNLTSYETDTTTQTIDKDIKQALNEDNTTLLNQLTSKHTSFIGKDSKGNTALHIALESFNPKTMMRILLGLPRESAWKKAKRWNNRINLDHKAKTSIKLAKTFTKGVVITGALIAGVVAVETVTAGGASPALVGIGISGIIVPYFQNLAKELGVIAKEFNISNPTKNIFTYSARIPLEKWVQDSIQIDARNNKGETALHIACKNQLERLAWILMHLGANPHIRDNKGRLPSYYAIVHENLFLQAILTPDITFDRIHGIDGTVNICKEFIHTHKKSLFLYGNHGTGKTMLAKSCGNELGYTYLSNKNGISIPELFSEAQKHIPVLLHISCTTKSDLQKLINQMKLNQNKNIIVVGSTSTLSNNNLIPDWHNAIEIGFDVMQKTNLPDEAGRTKIIQQLFNELVPQEKINPETFQQTAKETVGKSAAHLKKIHYHW